MRGQPRARGALIVRDQGGGPIMYVKWYRAGRPLERRVGRGWLVRSGESGAKPNGRTVGGWRDRRGRPDDGYLTVDAARELVPEVISRAERELTEREREERNDGSENVTVRAAADAWLEWGRRDDPDHGHEAWKHSTAKNNRHSANRISRELGDLGLGEVTEDALRAFLAALRPERNGREIADEASRRMRATYVLVLRGIFDHAVREGWIETSPADGLVIGRGKRKRDRHLRREQYFDVEEVRRVVAEAREGYRHLDHRGSLARLALMRRLTEQDAAMILTGAMTGLRDGELVALRWGDIDFEQSTIHVEQSRTLGVTGAPKSGHGRTVPMPEEVARELARLSLRGFNTGSTDLVFVGIRGGYVDLGGVRKRYYAAQERADVGARRTLHQLRHTFGVTMAKHGVPLSMIQHWLGHESIQTTMIYADFAPGHEHAALVSAAFAEPASA